jgi:hypothetical protein
VGKGELKMADLAGTDVWGFETNGKLDMGTTVEEVRSWAEVLKESPHKRPIWLERVQTCRDKAMTPRQTELSKRACTPIQRKVMVMREQYAVEEVARAFDKTAAEIDRIEAEGWLKLGSYHLITQPSATDEFMDPPRGGDTLAMMKEPAQNGRGMPKGRD